MRAPLGGGKLLGGMYTLVPPPEEGLLGRAAAQRDAVRCHQQSRYHENGERKLLMRRGDALRYGEAASPHHQRANGEGSGDKQRGRLCVGAGGSWGVNWR